MEDGAIEIKRMFVLPRHRGQGVGGSVLAQLEAWAAELGHSTIRLETSKRLSSAVGLYGRAGYEVVPNYGDYARVDDSVCMEKTNVAGRLSECSNL